MDTEKLRSWQSWIRTELESSVNFWLKNGMDPEHGGIYTCLTREGKVFSTDKSVWMQGRCGWIFAHMCRLYGTRPEWLEASRSCLDFMEDHCINRSAGNRMYFTVTADGKPLRQRRYCFSEEFYAIANAEYVIEGEVIPGVRVKEDQNSNTGYAMPEFPGYTGPASDQCWLIKVTAVTHRENPIMQTCIGPSEEHVSMAGIPTEASIYGMVEKAMPGRLQNVYCSSAGGGKYMAVLQFKKLSQSDEGRQRQAALLAFSAFSELKNVFLVDEDVDCFDMNDVLWAMNTRFQGDVDVITIPGVRCHPLDPSNDPAFSPSIRDHGIACKTIFDCTVPYDLKEDFHRARFMELDPEKWLKK